MKAKTIEYAMQSPTDIKTNTSLPPKPIKKRIFEKYIDNKNISRNIFEYSSPDTNISVNNNAENQANSMENGIEPNMTQQELLNKVVDRMFIDEEGNEEGYKEDSKETRKSGRSCKGKRYEKFMVEGKLLSGKRDKNQKYFDMNKKFDCELHSKIEPFKTEIQTPKIDLDDTIKRLAERTGTVYKIEGFKQKQETKKNEERTRSISETSDDSITRNLQNDFNLDLRIQNLPSLSYDSYVQRKRESKKRKIRPKTEQAEKSEAKNENNSLIGSKKRKNKHSITHLEKKPEMASFSNDLSGLATLAEVAANTEKIN